MSLEYIIEEYKSWSHDIKHGIFSKENYEKCKQAVSLFKECNKIFIAANGGSLCSCALHLEEDLIKLTNKRALTLSNPGMITCLENDYSHESVWIKWIEKWWEENDLLIAISSSGMSKNIINVCNYINIYQKGKIITFSGNTNRAEIPTLSIMGDVNFYIPTSSYGCAEIYHSLLLHIILDVLVKDNNVHISSK